MKTRACPVFPALTLLAAVALNIQLPSAFGQGSLAPPGPPAPTMKSLDQIEACTPIGSAATGTSPWANILH